MMNERIRQLAEQATEIVKCGLNGTSTAESFNRKKFAELIVQECREVLIDMMDEGRGDSLTLDIALIEIDDKFGVEE
jgi:hypothetical protein